ncbi:sperm-associated antigen 1 [Photinus pyralis]|nr:sperm-associated antigen 1 [Photinus pyralis]
MVQFEDSHKLPSFEENTSKPQKQTLLSRYQIPINHLDFAYVKACTNAKEIERIYRILQSGEEGHFPDLLKTTEERLKLLKPNSKYIQEICPVLKVDEVPKEEWNRLSNELCDWMEDANKKDEELNAAKVSEINCDVEIRKTKSDYKPAAQSNPKRIASTDYESWDKYDPETEILKMDLRDEKERNEALKRQTKLKQEKTVRFSNFATEAEAIYEANSERERGNECFKAGEFKMALRHYTQSLQCKPTASGFTNRAITYIKLKKFQLAINDCKQALNLDRQCFKAHLRLAQSYEALKQYEAALTHITTAVQIDPNNTTAQDIAKRLASYGPTVNKIRLTIEDVESTKMKPLTSILKSSTEISEKEVISIPGSSTMPPPFYVEVPTADPKVVEREKRKILSAPQLLHMTTIDPPSDEERDCESREPLDLDQDDCAISAKEGCLKRSKSETDITATGKGVTCEEGSKTDLLADTESDQKVQCDDMGGKGEPYSRHQEFVITEEDVQTPYMFTTIWNSVKNDTTYTHQAEILRKVDFERIHEVIGYNLDEGMLSSIIQCLHQHFMVPSELDRVKLALSNFNRIPRFQMMLLFLSEHDRKCIKQLMEFLDQHERNLENNVKEIYTN